MIQRVKGYTDEEIQYIIDNYHTSTNKEIAKTLNRSTTSITYVARMNNLIKQPHKDWTDEENKFLEENYTTMTTKELAKALDRTKPSIDSQKQKLGLDKLVKWTKEEEQFLIDNYLSMEHKEIGKVLNKTRGAVTAKCFDMDLVKCENWTQEDIDFLKENYQTISTKELAEILHRSCDGIQIKAERMHLKKFPYTCNYKFFSNIDTEEKAYWLGFLTADGWITKNFKSGSASTGVELQYGDIEHLRKFNKSIDGNYRITDRWRKCNLSSSDKLNHICKLRIYSKIMHDDLVNLGFTYTKSFDCFMPELREDLVRHYMRGYFDGNGCFSVSNNHLSVSVCTASKQIAEDFVNKLNNIGIDMRLYSYINENNVVIYRPGFSKVSEKLKFLDYIYDNCNIYLDRKYKKYLKAKRIYNEPQISMPHCLEINNL